ncbi:MAG TPA: hypothetical protein VIJ25_04655 [Methylococcales bacterium]
MNRFKQLVLSLALVFGMGMVAVPVAVHADAKTDACNAINAGADCSSTNGGADIGKVITIIVNVLSMVIGIIAVIMIMIGGFKYVISGGDANSVASAKNTVLYAVVGLIVVVLAQTVVRFVLFKLK